MYAAIRRYEGIDDPAEVARRAGEGFLPIVTDRPGFVSYSILDAGGGTLFSISVFETKDAAEASTQAAVGWVTENLAELVPQPPEVTTGELLLHRTA